MKKIVEFVLNIQNQRIQLCHSFYWTERLWTCAIKKGSKCLWKSLRLVKFYKMETLKSITHTSNLNVTYFSKWTFKPLPPSSPAQVPPLYLSKPSFHPSIFYHQLSYTGLRESWSLYQPTWGERRGAPCTSHVQSDHDVLIFVFERCRTVTV